MMPAQKMLPKPDLFQEEKTERPACKKCGLIMCVGIILLVALVLIIGWVVFVVAIFIR